MTPLDIKLISENSTFSCVYFNNCFNFPTFSISCNHVLVPRFLQSSCKVPLVPWSKLCLHRLSISFVVLPYFSNNYTLLLFFCSAQSHFVISLTSHPYYLTSDPRGLHTELTCHESFGQQLLNIPWFPVYLALKSPFFPLLLFSLLSSFFVILFAA